MNQRRNFVLALCGLIFASVMPLSVSAQATEKPATVQQPERQIETKSDSSATAQSAKPQVGNSIVEKPTTETITLGAGCFWCVEAVFQEVDGVISVKSGYCNGKTVNPTYQQVCTGLTGHAEVCQIVFDPNKVTLGKILHVFWRTHDPTTLNRQGADKGTQYRSGIYYHTDAQRQFAELYKQRLNNVGAFDDPVITEIAAVKNFSFAEDYHQNYFRNNPNAGYCRAVIKPKMSKFRAAFADVLKSASRKK